MAALAPPSSRLPASMNGKLPRTAAAITASAPSTPMAYPAVRPAPRPARAVRRATSSEAPAWPAARAPRGRPAAASLPVVSTASSAAAVPPAARPRLPMAVEAASSGRAGRGRWTGRTGATGSEHEVLMGIMLDRRNDEENTQDKALPHFRNPPERSSAAMGSRIERSLDATDWRILDELQADGRLSWNQLGRLVSLSPPAVAERVRRLEELGVIAGYQARVDPARAGLPLTAFVQMRCRLDRCLLKTSEASDYPEIVEIHKLTGDYCSMLKVRAASMEHFEGLLERVGQHGEMRTSVVLSTQFEGRPVAH